MIYSQIFDMVNIGIVILDKDLKVYKWNRWMELHSKIPSSDIIGSSIFDFFPDLNTPSFLRNCKSVLAFGNFSFISQKLHKYIFPFKAESHIGSHFEYMQQSCTLGPLRNEDNVIEFLYVSVQDVTETAAFQQELINMSIKDGLTGVFNRRYFEERIIDEVDRHKRYQRPMCLAMIDIDFFKKVNDTYGHQCGDFILKSVSENILKSIRNIDILSRYGGEEFCCLLLESDIKSSAIVAERLRKAISDAKFEFNGKKIPITISVGVSELNEKAGTPKLIIKEADEALYNAKETGRNKVVCAAIKN